VVRWPSSQLRKRFVSSFMQTGELFVQRNSHTLHQLSTDEQEILFGDGASSISASKIKSPRASALEEGSLDYASDPLINDLRLMRDTLTNCPQLWSELAKLCGSKRALFDEHMCDETVDVTFSEMNDLVRRSASVFQSLGVTKGQNVAILGENSARWLMADHGIQLAGGASAVRGADAPPDELRYIYEHSDSAGLVVLQGPKLLQKLARDAKAQGLSGLGLKNDRFGSVKTVILLHREKSTEEQIQEMAKDLGIRVLVFAELVANVTPTSDDQLPTIGLSDLSTIVYTSGTTGRPKGVMLEHGNLLHQIGHRIMPSVRYEDGDPLPGETMVSLLPVWHITERTFELWMASRGCNVVYSSIRSFKNDLAKHKPQWMVLVPRVLEKVAQGVQDKFAKGSTVAQTLVKIFTITSSLKAKHSKIAKGLVVGTAVPDAMTRTKSKLIVACLAPVNAVGNKLVWSKVQDGFGGQIKTIISGGSALAGSLETFYENCGLSVIVGYGLTECSPLLAHRRKDANLVTAGCTGMPTFETEIRVVDPEAKAGDTERAALPSGTAGVILGRGPQVMRGYYKNPDATAKAIDKFGWFDTGDLGMINPATGDLILTGRAKDTIVLSNGENIEPSPIEDAILSTSDLIEQVMLTGQDGRKLVAVVVLNPSELVKAGFLQAQDGEVLQKANEKINDPKCTPEDWKQNAVILSSAAERLRQADSLKSALVADTKKATKGFRAWEQVNEIYITLEPFAMVNGLLTQSYKVKRASVIERYGDKL
jgi:long-chain acyl-CoA synthetase